MLIGGLMFYTQNDTGIFKRGSKRGHLSYQKTPEGISLKKGPKKLENVCYYVNQEWVEHRASILESLYKVLSTKQLLSKPLEIQRGIWEFTISKKKLIVSFPIKVMDEL